MKKYIITSLLLFIPFISMAADNCTNPTEYTIDRRCYVTDEQKKETPYNAVVALVDEGSPYCTGTLAQWNLKDSPTEFYHPDLEYPSPVYLFTAAHCVSDLRNWSINETKQTVRIRLQDDREFDAKLAWAHGAIEDTDADWALYRLPSNMLGDDIKKVYADISGIQDGRDILKVGYGRLKIMSDQEIADFKRKYVETLSKRKSDPNESSVILFFSDDGDVHQKTGPFLLAEDGLMAWSYDGGILIDAIYPVMGDLREELFNDHKLKVSKCDFNMHSTCQGYRGDSGGPLFDKDNFLVGVHRLAGTYPTIGGSHHASSGYAVPTERIYKQMIQKMNKEKISN